MSLWSLTLEDFQRELASRAPTPGGGSAACVCGAFGLGLVSMALEISAPAPAASTSPTGRGLGEVLEDVRALGGELQAHADRDVMAFNQYMRARKLPRTSPSDRAAREHALAEAALAAARAPLEAARNLVRALELGLEAAPLVKATLASDVLGGADSARWCGRGGVAQRGHQFALRRGRHPARAPRNGAPVVVSSRRAPHTRASRLTGCRSLKSHPKSAARVAIQTQCVPERHRHRHRAHARYENFDLVDRFGLEVGARGEIERGDASANLARCNALELSVGHTGDHDVRIREGCFAIAIRFANLVRLAQRARHEELRPIDVEGGDLSAVVREHRRERPADDLAPIEHGDATPEQGESALGFKAPAAPSSFRMASGVQGRIDFFEPASS